MISIPLFLNSPHPCSYIDQHQAQFAYVHPELELNTALYSQLIEQGFRRSGSHVYRPQCASCTKCIPARLTVADFKASRQQRRTLKKNADIVVNIKPALFERPHYDLYLHYLRHRHIDGEMLNTNPQEYIHFLGSDWCNTIFVEFMIDNELAGIAVVDLLDNALSAVYTFFDPKFSSRSLGVFAVLWQIEHAQQLGLDWLYLGYWIDECQKMSYKTNYKPLHGLIDNEWQLL
ncbi:MAG: leucyl-tRNA---protein transferase [Methyloprofundus sp.]|nr:MAG: leucyl-tRNA---protein transferase [Methyloprofundus sp.]